MLIFLSGCFRSLALVEAVKVFFHDDCHDGQLADLQDILRGRWPFPLADRIEMHHLMDFDTFVHGILWTIDLDWEGKNGCVKKTSFRFTPPAAH
jgi:hypothetical protein